MLDKIIYTLFNTGWFFVALLLVVSAPVVWYYAHHPKEFWDEITHTTAMTRRRIAAGRV